MSRATPDYTPPVPTGPLTRRPRRPVVKLSARTNDLNPFRALTLFKSLGDPNHKTFLVRDGGSAPHLRRGEYAVIDTADRDLQSGELYVIQHGSGERRRAISQAKSDYLNITGPGADDSLVWWMRDLRGFRKTDETVHGGVPVFAGLSDGPYETEALQSRLVGRVIGVAFTPLGNLIASTAGWENEAAGNAAFDPAEYLDALLVAGYGPAVFICEGRPSYYSEHVPENRQGADAEAAVMAVRYKYCAASTALDRVKAECVRRGLVERGAS